MYEIERSRQRRRIHTESFLSRSCLPLVGEGGFEPFGDLAALLETTQQPGTTVTREPGEPIEGLTLLRDGELEVSLGEEPTTTLAAREMASFFLDGDRPIRYRNPGGQPVHFLELMFRAGSAAEARVEKARLPAEKGSFLLPIASGQGHPDVLSLALDAAVYWGRLLAGGNVIFETILDRKAFLLVLEGTVRVEEYRLIGQDYARIRRESSIPLFAQRTSEVVLIDVA